MEENKYSDNTVAGADEEVSSVTAVAAPDEPVAAAEERSFAAKGPPADGGKPVGAWKKNGLFIAIEALLFFSVVFMQWIGLESSITSLKDITGRAFFSTFVSFCVVLAVNALIAAISGRLALTLFITSPLFSLLAVANFYVNQLHGSPLRISELRSITTAMDVVSGYSITIPPKVIKLVVLFAIELLAAILAKRRILDRHKGNRSRIAGGAVFLAALCVVIGAFNSSKYKPVVGWSWTYAASTYGYPACLVEDTRVFITKFEKPEGYSEEKVDAIAVSKTGDAASSAGEYSDIILILNETFYDPAVSTTVDFQTDAGYLDYFYGLEGVARGMTAVPLTGTNATEYELLSSNSSALVNPSAPFNFISLEGQNTVVSYLKSLGYETWGLHNANSENYSRATAYKGLGFDHILFKESFEIRDKYGNRAVTDSGDYEQIIKCYESGRDGPRFIFLLTYQNHGGYEQNDDSFDTVHTLNDFGDYTDDVNEFLTSISMSDSALKELFDYFSGVDRHVTVAMIGDHPPIFTPNIMTSETPEDMIINYTTPFIVWSNYKELSSESGLATACDIVPMALEAGDVPLSVYYRCILDLQKIIPARNKTFALAADGSLVTIAENEEINALWTDYLYLEYNNLKGGSGRREALFEAPLN